VFEKPRGYVLGVGLYAGDGLGPEGVEEEEAEE
jgi:hypothetical protein